MKNRAICYIEIDELHHLPDELIARCHERPFLPAESYIAAVRVNRF